MDTHVTAVMHECTRASAEERITFPEVVGRLMAAGVERYHADLVRGVSTYYLPDDSSEQVAAHVAEAPAQAFSATGVEAAVRAIQRGEIKYREFCRRAAASGCVGYIASMAGRRVVYYGRTGETHVELFPAAP